MRQNCAYSAELTVEGKDAKLIPVTFETKLEDLTSTITFSKTFAEVIATCPVEDTTD